MYFMFNRACGHSIPIIILGFFNAILTYSILVVVVVVVGCGGGCGGGGGGTLLSLLRKDRGPSPVHRVSRT